MFEDLKEDFIVEFGEENFKKIESILDLFESEPFCDFEKDGITVSCSREKINQLQENVCVSISCDDFDIELLYENGINAGTRLNEYRINPASSFVNDKREYEVITGIELDIDAIDRWSAMTGKEYSLQKAEFMLINNRDSILKLIKNQNYDNYVTGGGTTKTDRYYDQKKSELNERGLFWKVKTRTEVTTANFF